MVAVNLQVTPKEVWEMDPKDLATVIDVMEEQAKRRR
jgi:hypothetical protein